MRSVRRCHLRINARKVAKHERERVQVLRVTRVLKYIRWFDQLLKKRVCVNSFGIVLRLIDFSLFVFVSCVGFLSCFENFSVSCIQSLMSCLLKCV